MTMWGFLSGNPITGLLMVFIISMSIFHIIALPFRLANRWIRHKDIIAKGWPPLLLDADGNFLDIKEIIEELREDKG